MHDYEHCKRRRKMFGCFSQENIGDLRACCLCCLLPVSVPLPVWCLNVFLTRLLGWSDPTGYASEVGPLYGVYRGTDWSYRKIQAKYTVGYLAYIMSNGSFTIYHQPWILHLNSEHTMLSTDHILLVMVYTALNYTLYTTNHGPYNPNQIH